MVGTVLRYGDLVIWAFEAIVEGHVQLSARSCGVRSVDEDAGILWFTGVQS